MAKKLPFWKKLKRDEVEAWCGSRSFTRGEKYQQNGHVRELGFCADGAIVATVSGTEKYVTKVMLDAKKLAEGRIRSECSCSVGYDCKHAVASVLEMMAIFESGGDIGTVDADDFRLKLLNGEELDANDRMPASRERQPKTKPSRGFSDDDIRKHLDEKSKSEIIDLLMGVCGRDSDVRKSLVDELALAVGRMGDLLAEAFAEMRSVTAEDAWQNPWEGEGYLPNFRGLQKRMKTLLAHGHANDLVTLGVELLRRGTDQINRSHDDGHTCGEVAACMAIVADAVEQAAMPDDQRLHLVISMMLEDGFGVCGCLERIADQKWGKETWSKVADRLLEKLAATPLKDEGAMFSMRNYQRERLSDWVVKSLTGAGRDAEARDLCVKEARAAGSYERAVRLLIADQLLDEAQGLAIEGLDRVDPLYRGIIDKLQNMIAEIAEKRGDRMVPAALAAERFFDSPSPDGFQELIKAAKKAKVESIVEPAARKFLETGIRPDLDRDGVRRAKPSKAWPLPRAPLGSKGDRPLDSRKHRRGPEYSVLITLAIRERQPLEVLRWYDARMIAGKSQSYGRFTANRNDAFIAEAVQSTHPERAIEIYLALAHLVAMETNTKTYPEVGHYLKKIKPLLSRAKSPQDWAGILAEFRSQHARKSRLMDVLRRLDRSA
jgi:uncharacterized Zn finger protein